MIITEVRIKLADDGGNGNGRLLAFASVTFDRCFVVKDVKLIDGADGLYAAMPTRLLMDRCPGCGSKNPLKSRYCGHCGLLLAPGRASINPATGRLGLHAEVCHPIDAATRLAIEGAVVAAWREAVDVRVGEGVGNG
jgi:stage V sporulation protein G